MNFYPLFDDLFEFMKTNQLAPWLVTLIPLLEQKLQENPHGDLKRWQAAFDQLPDIEADQINLNQARVGASLNTALDDTSQKQLEDGLKGLLPWRKGPYELFGTHIETEWRSDWKWDRIKEHISPLKNRLILDVGCGSGYHCWRMLNEAPQHVIGIDPNFLFLFQFEALKKYCGVKAPIHLLPVRMEDVPEKLGAFDTTFSMGVLYHRRSPIDHLIELKDTLVKGGELVLETLVCDGELGFTLMPEDRYAMMRNVWSIPSIPTLALWLRRAGFENITCIESNQTSLDEQHSTDWMQYQSLKDFLDPNDTNLTIEGYPAPKRATFIARKKY
ncbi:MAG: tRNA (mo5U34)-methyltransferase [Oleiphilaceae bacterium]|jgi:tRNA (mo5U34)-methyltransferase